MAGIPARSLRGWLYAVRLRGRPGWHWEPSALGQDAYRAALAGAGLEVEEVAVVQDFTIDPRRDGTAGTLDFIYDRWGEWLYDTEAKCWRAADEPITRPPGTPVPVDSVGIAFSLPEFGWLPITLTAGNQEVSFEASDVYDPFPDLIVWLESLAAGADARLSIDTEGDVFVDFHVFSADAPLVRLLVRIYERGADGGITPKVDVLVDRMSLVRTLYSTCITFWESEELCAAWDNWNTGKEVGDLWVPYPLRSERLDRLISGVT
ncbi:hypothetical protein [Caenispirillum bisanense]|uniref:hypothetical protein n=1 Tax=Caenispirillum bisanense TaxID=414052 RepID=UPI0031DEE7A6